jgi:hypothetical protein
MTLTETPIALGGKRLAGKRNRGYQLNCSWTKALIFCLFVCYDGFMGKERIEAPHSFSRRRYIDRPCRDAPHLFKESIAFCRDKDAKWHISERLGRTVPS